MARSERLHRPPGTFYSFGFMVLLLDGYHKYSSSLDRPQVFAE